MYTALLVMLLGFAEVRIPTDDAVKAATQKTPPDYPRIARQLRVAGHVEVEVTIDSEGNVESVRIVSGNAMLTQSVVTAVKKWKFTPFKQGDAPTKAIAALDFDFKM
jgi:TonB family protein